MIHNPIIPGFNPDPSIVRVGDDFYLATSSFSYFPGIPLYHSRDLEHWELVNYAFTNPDYLPLAPDGISGGLFAPTLRYHDGKFYLIVVNMSVLTTYIVTADDPRGEWSEPHKFPMLFDPDIFWDDDGSCFITYAGSMMPGGNDKYRIVHRELDLEKWELVGEEYGLWTSALVDASAPEAPHIYHVGDWYYLMIAEGGTEHYHAVTIARSRTLHGPYEGYRGNPILTHRHLSNMHPICNVGHADLVELKDGSWYAVFLGSRIYGGYHKNMGRETFIAPVVWEDGWPVISPETGKCEFTYPSSDLPAHPFPEKPARDDFDGEKLSLEWNWLGTPANTPTRLEDGKLVIRAEGTIRPEFVKPDIEMIMQGGMKFTPHALGFLGRRQQHMSFEAKTHIEFAPTAGSFAGLAIIQNNYAGMSIELAEKDGRRVLRAVKHAAWQEGESFTDMQIKSETEVLAEVEWEHDCAVLEIKAAGQSHSFLYGEDEEHLRPLYEGLDGGYIGSETAGGFVGAFIGMFASGDGGEAKFDWFEYK